MTEFLDTVFWWVTRIGALLIAIVMGIPIVLFLFSLLVGGFSAILTGHNTGTETDPVERNKREVINIVLGIAGLTLMVLVIAWLVSSG